MGFNEKDYLWFIAAIYPVIHPASVTIIASHVLFGIFWPIEAIHDYIPADLLVCLFDCPYFDFRSNPGSGKDDIRNNQ